MEEYKNLVNESEVRHLLEIYTGSQRELLETIKKIIIPYVDKIASTFYDEMLSIPETMPFLDHQIVSQRLRKSMALWITRLFSPGSKEEMEKHLKRQFEVGNVHARINVPIHLVNHGIRILKRECSHYITQSLKDKNEVANALVMINELLDYSIASINESYMNDLVVNERNAQSLQMHATGPGLAMECERMRSVLFDWLRKTLTLLYKNEPITSPPSIYSSDFGLWVVYKADMLFADYQDTVEKLKGQTQEIEETVRRIVEFKNSKPKKSCSDQIEALNELITGTGWILSSFVDHTLDIESGRDPLTRLFNRRYMATIMQKAIRISTKHRIPFAVLLFDIDHFKKINDTYGHDAGDTILVEFSELLAMNIRASDYVFRYGGEEFLILLSGASLESTEKTAEKLRQLVEKNDFIINQTQRLKLTTSIGVAIHDGHPDYSRVITKADEALYKAKTSGRNRIFISS